MNNAPISKPNSKHVLTSRTLWLNVIAAMLMALETHLHLLQNSMGNQWYVVAVITLAGANVFMRFITHTAVHITGDNQHVD